MASPVVRRDPKRNGGKLAGENSFHPTRFPPLDSELLATSAAGVGDLAPQTDVGEFQSCSGVHSTNCRSLPSMSAAGIYGSNTQAHRRSPNFHFCPTLGVHLLRLTPAPQCLARLLRVAGRARARRRAPVGRERHRADVGHLVDLVQLPDAAIALADEPLPGALHGEAERRPL